MQRSDPIGINANMKFGSSLDTELDPHLCSECIGFLALQHLD